MARRNKLQNLPHPRSLRKPAAAKAAATSHRDQTASVPSRTGLWTACSILLLVTIWAYWNSLAQMAHRWNHDVQYSHGYLVPVFSAVLLWARRGKLEQLRPTRDWRGLVLILLGIVLRLGATVFFCEWIDNISLVPVCLGIALLCGGPTVLRWSWSAILFLFFMVPLPYTLDVALTAPLRTIGTVASTYMLQTLGVSAYAEGHIISVAGEQIGVAEACSGMRMMMIFFAVTTAVAMTIRRTHLERLFIAASAVPIALAVNIARITATGLLHATGRPLLAGWFFHDLAGWLMMPLALVLLQCELAYLKRLLLEEVDAPMTAGISTDRIMGEKPHKTSCPDGVLTVARTAPA